MSPLQIVVLVLGVLCLGIVIFSMAIGRRKK